MTRTPEHILIVKLAQAAEAVADGADEALTLLGPLPDDAAAFASLDVVQRTAARALLKAVEQQEDVLARLFRTFLSAEAFDTVPMTARDVANIMEKLGGIDDAYVWSDLVKLRNRLAHEYPVSPTAQLERVREAAEAVPVLRSILVSTTRLLSDRGHLP